MRKYAVISCALLFTGALSSVAAKSVQFRFTDTIARSVSVIGSFNQFDPAANPMHRGAYGAWTSSISLPTGTHTYAFLVDGEYRVRDRYAPNHEVAADHQIASVISLHPTPIPSCPQFAPHPRHWFRRQPRCQKFMKIDRPRRQNPGQHTRGPG